MIFTLTSQILLHLSGRKSLPPSMFAFLAKYCVPFFISSSLLYMVPHKLGLFLMAPVSLLLREPHCMSQQEISSFSRPTPSMFAFLAKYCALFFISSSSLLSMVPHKLDLFSMPPVSLLQRKSNCMPQLLMTLRVDSTVVTYE